MHFSQLSVLALSVATAAATPMALEKRVTCTNQAVIFAVRGSDSAQTTLGYNPRYAELPPGMTNTANAIKQKAGGNSYLQAISYPAVNPDPPSFSLYGQSVAQGASALTKAVLDYVNNCPAGKIFIIGYSQGAQVISTALGSSEPLRAKGRVTGVVLFADPTYLDGQEPIDAGSGENNGRSGTGVGDGNLYRNLNARYPNRLRSFCQADDLFCDSGSSGQIHGDAPQTFQGDAIAFLTAKV